MSFTNFFRNNSKALILAGAIVLVVLIILGISYYVIDRDDTALPDENGDKDSTKDPEGDDPDIDDPDVEEPDPEDPVDQDPVNGAPIDEDLNGKDPAKPKPPYTDDPGDKDDEEETWYIGSQSEIVTGTGGAVSSSDYTASMVAAQVLKDGGNAIDAAIALGLFMNVAEPNNSGLGGIGSAVIYMAETETIESILFRGMVPLELDSSVYRDNPEMQAYGLASAMVPGTLRGYLDMLERHGTMSFEELVQPTIVAAREGFTVGSAYVNWLMDRLHLLLRDPETADIYVPGGFPLVEGQVVKNPNLADFLERLVAEGPESFYTGSVAEDIVEGARAHGSFFTLEDFATIESRWQEPVQSNYRGYDVYTTGIPTFSAIICAKLNIMENFDLPSMAPDAPERIHIIAEANKQTRMDRAVLIADPYFYEDMQDKYKILLSDVYAKDIAANIDFNHSSREQIAISDDKILEFMEEITEESHTGTTHFSVVDKDKNMVVVSQTLGPSWGAAQVVPGTGLLLNRYLNNMSLSETSYGYMRPGATSRSTTCPTIVAKDGKPVYGLGAPGAAQIPSAVLQVISNLIDHNMDMAEAVEHPRFHADRRQQFVAEPRFSPTVFADLTAIGHDVRIRSEYDTWFGRVNMVAIDWEKGLTQAVDDLRALDGGSVAVK